MLKGIEIYEPKRFIDNRGYFTVTWNSQEVPYEFKQDNLSFSHFGVLRGLHFQKDPYAQGKYVGVAKGTVVDVAVDIRKDSDTFGQHVTVELSEHNNKRMYIPPGFAHGFVVVSVEGAIFHYKCTELYHPESEDVLAWNDPSVNINWPKIPLFVSDKDKNGKRLDEI